MDSQPAEAGPSSAPASTQAAVGTQSAAEASKTTPVVILCIGMAGSVSAALILLPDKRKAHTDYVVGQDDPHAALQLSLAFQEYSSVYPQPRPRGHSHAILCQYRYTGYRRLQRGHEAVSGGMSLYCYSCRAEDRLQVQSRPEWRYLDGLEPLYDQV